jgi:hypothetical protein
VGVEIVCIDCHDIHHWARTTKLFEDGTITAERYNQLRKRFRRVNRCCQTVFDAHFLWSMRVWMERSRKRWTVDWGDFSPEVAKAKAARGAWAARKYDVDVPGDDMQSRWRALLWRAIGKAMVAAVNRFFGPSAA